MEIKEHSKSDCGTEHVDAGISLKEFDNGLKDKFSQKISLSIFHFKWFVAILVPVSFLFGGIALGWSAGERTSVHSHKTYKATDSDLDPVPKYQGDHVRLSMPGKGLPPASSTVLIR